MFFWEIIQQEHMSEQQTKILLERFAFLTLISKLLFFLGQFN